MTEYALVGPQDQIKTTSSNVDPTVSTRQGWRWLPVEVTDPAFDGVTQVKEGPTVTVLADKVTRVWTVRNKTAQEISDDKDAALSSTLNGSPYTPLLKILLNIQNRLLTLEGKPTQTLAQLKTQLRALL